MARASKAGTKPQSKVEPALLKGWQQIAEFLGQPTSVAQRWAKTGMPVKQGGRFVTATPEELNKWLGGKAGGEPLHVATEQGDLSGDLKRGLAYLPKPKAPAAQVKLSYHLRPNTVSAFSARHLRATLNRPKTRMAGASDISVNPKNEQQG